ncbi:MAG TPA: hypothetical protein VHC95_02810 [Opitutales bacterium]|nr:hypothetical protein [Opitutales bacterium]
MNRSKRVQVISALAAVGALAALAGCKDYDLSPKSDFAEKAMERHYQNGEMNQYEYQDNVKVFLKPGEQTPGLGEMKSFNDVPPPATTMPPPNSTTATPAPPAGASAQP